MKILEHYLNINKEKDSRNTWVTTEERGNISAVVFDGFSQCALDPDSGAEIIFNIDDVVSWTAIYRDCEWWCRPTFGTDVSTIPNETQCLIYKNQNGSFGIVLPVVSEEYKCVLSGSDNAITAKLFSWSDKLNSCHALAFMYAEGDDPFELIGRCTKEALSILNTGCRIREERTFPDIMEYIGWCSWDAFHVWVSEEDLIHKSKEFKEKNIPVKWFMIDDMWAEIHDFYHYPKGSDTPLGSYLHASSLYSFNADPLRFPNGMRHCVNELKKDGLKVGIWHPTTGYWKGIDRNSPAYKELRDYLIEASDGTLVPDYKTDKAFLYYSDLHDYIRKCGADIVKIDNQSISRRYYKGLAPVGKAAKNYHDALEASAASHFGNNIINCMGMASEDIWNRNVSPISRCSNDFSPENPKWFINQLLQCAYNSFYLGQFYYCDWDMWWTDDSQALKNSLLRAVSGGPIYISDELGRSKRDVLMPLILNDGRILRCDRPAMPTADCLTDDPISSGRPFKIQNICNGSGVISVFNISSDETKAAEGSVSPSDIPGIKGETFAVYEYFSRKLEILEYNDRSDIVLNSNSDILHFIVVPIKKGFAPIGRIDKYISPRTIKCVSDNKMILSEYGPNAYVLDNKLIINE